MTREDGRNYLIQRAPPLKLDDINTILLNDGTITLQELEQFLALRQPPLTTEQVREIIRLYF